MPIRPRQKLFHCAASAIILQEVRKNEATDEVEICHVDQSDFELPDVEMYDLKTCLQAGVNLKQVNSKILPTSDYRMIVKDDETVKNETETQTDDGEN